MDKKRQEAVKKRQEEEKRRQLPGQGRVISKVCSPSIDCLCSCTRATIGRSVLLVRICDQLRSCRRPRLRSPLRRRKYRVHLKCRRRRPLSVVWRQKINQERRIIQVLGNLLLHLNMVKTLKDEEPMKWKNMKSSTSKPCVFQ